MGIDVPLIGDFHYNGHKLLTDSPGLRRGAVEVPHQPGQRRQGREGRPAVRADGRDRGQARQGGAHRRQLGQPRPGTARAADGRERQARRAARCRSRSCTARSSQSAIESARARRGDRPAAASQIILSCKMSAGVQDLMSVYRALAKRCDYALHLGLTEAGMGTKGTVASSGRRWRCCCRTASATPSASRLTPQPGEARTQEVVVGAGDPAVARPARLQPERDRLPGLRPHHQHHLPGAGQADRRLPARADAGVEGALSRRRDDEGRGDGLHRQRPGREQACRHRHQPARYGRGAGRAGVHRRRRRR